MKLLNDFEKIIVNEEQINQACTRLASDITKDYQDSDKPIFLGILKGCHPFMTELLNQVDLYHTCDYMDVSSYFGGSKSTGEVKIIMDMHSSVENKDVIIVEDVVESGRTIQKVIDLLKFRGAKSVEVVTMVDKPLGRNADLKPKYIGFEIKDGFLIGYGLDYKEMYRNVKAIGIPKKEIIKED
ncbi:MAG: hypoxanthine phosphoribosyltransferase [Mycoplasmatales bacterium]